MVRQPQSDEAGADHVLDGLPKSQVGSEGQQSHQLRETHVTTIP